MKNGRSVIGARIDGLLKEKRMTQRELSEHLGVDFRMVNRWITQDVIPSSKYLLNIADLLDVTPEFLFGVSDNESADNHDVAVGARLEEYRKKLNMTHERFAIYLNVSQSQVRNYQKGRQPVPETVVQKLANGNPVLESFLRGCPDVTIDDVEIDLSKTEKMSFLQYYTTDELLAELKRRIEAP